MEQDNRCLYCGQEFGTLVIRRGNDWNWLHVTWDHFVPYTYSERNEDENWVAACQLCNGYKSSLVFADVLEVRTYILNKAIKNRHDPLPFWYTPPTVVAEIEIEVEAEVWLAEEDETAWLADGDEYEPWDMPVNDHKGMVEVDEWLALYGEDVKRVPPNGGTAG
jgi:hypothetical protein